MNKTLHYKVNVKISVGCDIPQDLAWNAFLSKYCAKFDEGMSPDQIGEEMLLASLRSRSQWDEAVWGEISRRVAAKDKDFLEKLFRSVRRSHKPLFSDEEIFLLRYWRKTPNVSKGRQTPGLEDWSPRAICELMTYIGFNPIKPKTLRDAKIRLGLPSRSKYMVSDLIAGDGEATIVFSDMADCRDR